MSKYKDVERERVFRALGPNYNSIKNENSVLNTETLLRFQENIMNL